MHRNPTLQIALFLQRLGLNGSIQRWYNRKIERELDVRVDRIDRDFKDFKKLVENEDRIESTTPR